MLRIPVSVRPFDSLSLAQPCYDRTNHRAGICALPQVVLVNIQATRPNGTDLKTSSGSTKYSIQTRLWTSTYSIHIHTHALPWSVDTFLSCPSSHFYSYSNIYSLFHYNPFSSYCSFIIAFHRISHLPPLVCAVICM